MADRVGKLSFFLVTLLCLVCSSSWALDNIPTFKAPPWEALRELPDVGLATYNPPSKSSQTTTAPPKVVTSPPVYLPPPKKPTPTESTKDTCQCKCKTVMVQKCKEITEDKCHTEYEMKCEVQLSEETCIEKPKQTCHTSYQQQCRPVEECKSTVKKKCIDIPYQVCVNEPVCTTRYKKKCKQTYNHGKKCKQFPQEECKYEEKCSTKYKQKCSDIPEEICFEKEQCQDVPVQHCETVMEKHCKKEPVKTCSQLPKQKCTKVKRRVAQMEKVEECQRCSQTQKQVKESVPKKKCFQEPEEVCKTVYEPECKPIPEKKCVEVLREQCTETPTEVCETVFNKHCRKKPLQDCSQTYEKVCKPEQICHTRFEMTCKKPSSPPSSSYERKNSSPSYRRPHRYRPSPHEVVIIDEPLITSFNTPTAVASSSHSPLHPSLTIKGNLTDSTPTQETFGIKNAVFDPLSLATPENIFNQLGIKPMKSKMEEKQFNISPPPFKGFDRMNNDVFQADFVKEVEKKFNFIRLASTEEGVTTPSHTATTTSSTLSPLRRRLGLRSSRRRGRHERNRHSHRSPRKDVVVEGLVSLDYGYVKENCKYHPKKECVTELKCEAMPKTKCRVVLDEICDDVPKKQCKTEKERRCENVPHKKCQRVYETKCEQVPRKKCQTVMKEKCNTVIVEVIKYKTVNQCYWPPSSAQNEPCH